MFIHLFFIVSTVVALESKTINVQVQLNYEVISLQAACVERFNSESESSGVEIYYDSASFKQLQTLKAKDKFSDVRLVGSEVCARPQHGGTLTYVAVGQFSKLQEITQEIIKAGGFKTTKVILYNESDLQKQWEQSVDQIFSNTL